MSHFLLIFDRRNRHADVEQLSDGDIVGRLLKAEARLKEEPWLEVVLLTAADEDDLRRTHSRYFESIDELLETTS
jgi:hypothetical protein